MSKSCKGQHEVLTAHLALKDNEPFLIMTILKLFRDTWPKMPRNMGVSDLLSDNLLMEFFNSVKKSPERLHHSLWEFAGPH